MKYLGLLVVGLPALLFAGVIQASPGSSERVGPESVGNQGQLQSSAIDLSGAWNLNYQVTGFLGLGSCTATFVQADSSISGEISCEYAVGGSLIGTVAGTAMSVTASFTSPAYVVSASGSVSSDGASMNGTWQCTTGCPFSGTFTGMKAPTPTPSPTPPHLPIEAQLGDCLTVTNIAWAHNNQTKQWASFDPDLPPALLGLTQFLPNGGYFAYTIANCTINSGANVVPLYTGWNLFGWR